MKRIIAYVLIGIITLLIPVDRVDIGTLEPIQAVWLSTENGRIILITDTDDRGEGKTVKEALEKMKRSSTGNVYLDTAEFLLVSENAQAEIVSIKPYLKPSVRVCLFAGQMKLTDAAAYMDAHSVGLSLREWEQYSILPKIPQ